MLKSALEGAAVQNAHAVHDEICSDTMYSESESKKNESREVFSFKSDFNEDDIKNQLEEIFKDTNETSTKIICRDQLVPRMYLYTLELKMDKGKTQKASFSWSQMSFSQKDVFQNLKRIF